jgi:hypothetical protein
MPVACAALDDDADGAAGKVLPDVEAGCFLAVGSAFCAEAFDGDPDDPVVSANATAGTATITEPTPNATASAPTRPINFEWLGWVGRIVPSRSDGLGYEKGSEFIVMLSSGGYARP